MQDSMRGDLHRGTGDRGKRARALRLFGRGVAATALTVLLLGCGAGGERVTTVTTGSAEGGKPVRLEFKVGEQAAIGDVKIEVTTLMLTDHPTAPLYGVVNAGGLALAEGEAYCQAFVKVKNDGQNAVRVDPADFALNAAGQAALMDKARTGPPAHSLLHGASIDLILTFVLPAGSEASLLYRPAWFNGTLVFTGYEKPPGVV